MNDAYDNEITLWVANLAEYNSGNDIGRPITLPAPVSEVEQFMSKVVGVGPDAGEHIILDMQNLPFMQGARGYWEHENVFDINDIALQIKCMTDSELEAAETYVNYRGDASALEALNACLQADEITYYPFNWERRTDDSEYAAIHNGMTDYEKLGEALLEGHPELSAALKDPCLAGYFDIESYGRNESCHVSFGQNGYLELDVEQPKLDEYTREEASAAVRENLVNSGYADLAESMYDGRAEKDRHGRVVNTVSRIAVPGQRRGDSSPAQSESRARAEAARMAARGSVARPAPVRGA